jgi:hypothetical protein
MGWSTQQRVTLPVMSFAALFCLYISTCSYAKFRYTSRGRYRFSYKAGGFDLKPIDALFPPLQVGDSVQRGLDWRWSDQDGNGIGIVAAPLDDNGWIGVSWNSGVRGKYRYSEQAGGHDIQLCRATDGIATSAVASTAHVSKGNQSPVKSFMDDLVPKLVGMGFSAGAAAHALRESEGDLNEAIEFLIRSDAALLRQDVPQYD